MTSRFFARLLGLFLLLAAFAASAAPTQVEAVYEATRNGQPFATVTETSSPAISSCIKGITRRKRSMPISTGLPAS